MRSRHKRSHASMKWQIRWDLLTKSILKRISIFIQGCQNVKISVIFILWRNKWMNFHLNNSVNIKSSHLKNHLFVWWNRGILYNFKRDPAIVRNCIWCNHTNCLDDTTQHRTHLKMKTIFSYDWVECILLWTLICHWENIYFYLIFWENICHHFSKKIPHKINEFSAGQL